MLRLQQARHHRRVQQPCAGAEVGIGLTQQLEHVDQLAEAGDRAGEGLGLAARCVDDALRLTGIAGAIDQAVVQPERKLSIKPLPIYYASYPTAGEDVVALGSPAGLTNTVTRGIISAVRRAGSSFNTVATESATLLQTDAAINPGNSGGTLLNANGEVIGINTFKKTKSEGLNFAVSIIDILQQLKVARPSEQFQEGLNECGNKFET